MDRVFTKQIIEDLNVSKLNFVLIAAKIARANKVSASNAIRMLEDKEVTPDEIEELIIEDLQKVHPEPEPEPTPEPTETT